MIVQAGGQQFAYRYGPGTLVRVNEALISFIWAALIEFAVVGILARDLPSGDQNWKYAAAALIPVGGILAIWRSFRLELDVTTERVRIRNYWRDSEFPWMQVDDVTMGSALQGVMLQPAITFRLLDGSKRRAKATPYGNASDRQHEAMRAIVALSPADAPFRLRWAKNPPPVGRWRPDMPDQQNPIE